MTTHDRFDTEPTTTDEFHTALTTLIASAVNNDVPVEGGWDVRENGIAWGVEIYAVRDSSSR